MTQELRHFCRHCRGKLASPTANHREAFDSKGCHGSFYRRRCIVCERDMPRLKESQRTCYRAECKEKWRKKTIQSHFVGHGSLSDKHPLKTSIKPGVKSGVRSDRPKLWTVVAAGTPITANQYHCATVPDGPNCEWANGEYERIEAKNRAALRKAEEAEIEANGYFTDTEWREVISPDGVRCFVAADLGLGVQL
jgi:hypothetical protein